MESAPGEPEGLLGNNFVSGLRFSSETVAVGDEPHTVERHILTLGNSGSGCFQRERQRCAVG